MTPGVHSDMLNIDVTTLVQDMLQNPASSYGFELQLANEAYYRSLVFSSSDVDDETRTPRLEICYSSTTGITNLDGSLLHIYPNPTTNLVSIQAKLPDHEPVQLILTDALGKIVFAKSYSISGSGIQENIDVSAWSAGVYFIELHGKASSLAGKLVKY